MENNNPQGLDTPRDRLGSFEPEIVKKRETIMAANLEDKIIGLYGLGKRQGDISAHIKETYDTYISAAMKEGSIYPFP